MGKKDFLIEMGERSVDPVGTDVLLGDKIAERKRKQVERQEELDEAEHEAKMAKYKKDTKSAEAVAEKTGEKKDSEVGIKTSGEIKIGTFDLQAMLKQAQEERDNLKKEQEENIRVLGQENEKLRDQIHQKEIDVLKLTLETRIENLTKLIEGGASKNTFTEQLEAARTIAKELGYSPGSGSSGTEASLQLELKRLDFEQTKMLRDMQRADKDSDRKWQLELRRLDDEREAARAQLTQVQKRDEMIAKAPELVGRAIGRAILEGSGGVETESQTSAISSKGKQPGIEAGFGESGTADCINCHQPIAVGPTARTAVCAGCGAKYPIRRVKTEEPAPGENAGSVSGTGKASPGEEEEE